MTQPQPAARAASPALADDLALAHRLADLADEISLARFRASDLDVSLKRDRTHVTDADQAVEAAIVAELVRSRPDDAVYGEETGHHEGASSAEQDASARPHREWIIDPIDGTANFMRGVPVWATLIALAIDGEPVVGVASAPALGRRWSAARGLGARLHEAGRGEAARVLVVSSITTLNEAAVNVQVNERGDSAERRLFDAALEGAWRVRGFGDFWPYLLVAEGAMEAAAEDGLMPYDAAAVVAIAREAGAIATTMGGQPLSTQGGALSPGGGSLLVASPGVHSAMLGLVDDETPRPRH